MRIYFIPFLASGVLFLVFMRVADVSGREMHLSNAQAASFIIGHNVFYLAASPLAGHLLRTVPARTVLVGAIGGLLCCSVPLFFSTSFAVVLALISIMGIAGAFTLNSFQAFMRDFVAPGQVHRAASFYTAARSFGTALGFICAGLFAGISPAALVFCSVLACGLILGIALKSPLAAPAGRASESPANDTLEHVSSLVSAQDAVKYIPLGWLLSLTANLTQRPLTVFLPKFEAQSGHPAWIAGSLLFTLFLFQGLLGVVHGQVVRNLYRPAPLLASQCVLLLGLTGLWFSPSPGFSLGAMAVLGLAYGFAQLSSLYYVSCGPASTGHVGINEAMIALGNTIGIGMVECFVRYTGSEAALYPALISAIVLTMGMQWRFLRRAPHRPAGRPDLLLAKSAG